MVAEYVAGLKVAWDVAKALKVATDSIDDAHIKLQMAELISALADAKIEAADNAETIAELQNILNTKESLNFENGMYFRNSEDGNKDGPFCQQCYDSEGLLMRLVESTAFIPSSQQWGTAQVCRKCESVHG